MFLFESCSCSQSQKVVKRLRACVRACVLEWCNCAVWTHFFCMHQCYVCQMQRCTHDVMSWIVAFVCGPCHLSVVHRCTHCTCNCSWMLRHCSRWTLSLVVVWSVNEVCRCNRHSARSLGWPFSMLKFEFIFQIKYTEAILSNSTRKLLWFEITEILVAV